jgi:hypothetical protein
VTWRAAGFHSWPQAAGARGYLAARHRDVFHYRVELDVNHDDRDVEFHDVLDACRAMTREDTDWDARSCEAIGRLILAELDARWPGRSPVICVSEDGECGATVTS